MTAYSRNAFQKQKYIVIYCTRRSERPYKIKFIDPEDQLLWQYVDNLSDIS